MRTLRPMPQGAFAAGVAAAADRDRFSHAETGAKLGADGLRSSRRSACGSVLCVRDITLTDGRPSRPEPQRPSEPADPEPALDSTGVVRTRGSESERTRLAGGDSLAAALTSYCEDGGS